MNQSELAKAIGGLEQYAHQCHACSLAMVRSGLLPKGARVARGWHTEIQSQHSWVYFGDPYNPQIILDGTLWSYIGAKPFILIGDGDNLEYRAHGAGELSPRARAIKPTMKLIELDGPLSANAKSFLDKFAPNGMDVRGWMGLVNGPMEGWPSKEIISLMASDKKFAGLIPIDIIGMLTDTNPGELYF